MNLISFLNSKNYTPELITILLGISKGSIKIHEKLNEENANIFGSSGKKNIQNEDVQKLDLIANDVFINVFHKMNIIHSILSEEDDDIIPSNNNGEYLVAMDPLDGSSNIDVNIPVGSIFSILKNTTDGFLQKGLAQELACYVIYGTTTMMVFALKNEVFGFTLNTKNKDYVLSHPNIKTPNEGSIFSINEGNLNSIAEPIVQFVNYCKALDQDGKRTHTGRFVGSLVADFHRNMLKGGIFIYPQTNDKPQGQLRLIYECNPIAFIANAANALSTDLEKDVLSVSPKSVHQRTPFVVGSTSMVKKLLSFYNL